MYLYVSIQELYYTIVIGLKSKILSLDKTFISIARTDKIVVNFYPI